MKLTKSQLREMIREEIKSLNESMEVKIEKPLKSVLGNEAGLQIITDTAEFYGTNNGKYYIAVVEENGKWYVSIADDDGQHYIVEPYEVSKNKIPAEVIKLAHKYKKKLT
jgi:dsDNA-specific endonuclease/ATPase MutS2